MISWIEKTIYPPGIQKPNRFALFSVVGKIMSLVRKDAEKAFYAHFPYLADDEKLEEHGKALFIPHLPHDIPEEFRNRVAAASFFLMRTGERAYIMEQLKERFGDRFQVIEKHLSIYTRVTNITNNERVWVLSLLDSLVDPNIYLELTDWLHYIEHIPSHDAATYTFKRQDIDLFDGKIYRNGRILRDGHTVLNAVNNLRNGFWNRNGKINRGGVSILPDTGAVRIPILHQSGMHDISKMKSTISTTDSIEDVHEQLMAGMWKHHFYNGKYKRNGNIMRDGMMLIPLE